MVRCDVCDCFGAYRQWTTYKGVFNQIYSCKRRSIGGCPNRTPVSESDIRDAVVAALTEKAQEIINLEEAPPDILFDPELSNLMEQLRDLERISAPSRPIRQAIKEMKSQIECRRNELTLEKLRDENRSKELVEAFSDPLFWTEYIEKKMTIGEIRTYYLKWIKAIRIRDGKVTGIQLKI